METIHTHSMRPEFALAKQLAVLLDGQFKVGKWSFGLDVILDALPIGGDVLILILSLYAVAVAVRNNVPTAEVARMLGNIGIAFVLGLIPVVGELSYLTFRPNARNWEILSRYA